MRLFGDRNEPRLEHFEASREHGDVVLRWDVRDAPALRWRVLRSERDFAETADALPGSGQTLVSESANCGARDDQIPGKATCFYTVFAQDGQGLWHRQVKVKIDHGDRLRWRSPKFEMASSANPTSELRNAHAEELVLQNDRSGHI